MHFFDVLFLSDKETREVRLKIKKDHKIG